VLPAGTIARTDARVSGEITGFRARNATNCVPLDFGSGQVWSRRRAGRTAKSGRDLRGPLQRKLGALVEAADAGAVEALFVDFKVRADERVSGKLSIAKRIASDARSKRL